MHLIYVSKIVQPETLTPTILVGNNTYATPNETIVKRDQPVEDAISQSEAKVLKLLVGS